MTFEAGQYAAIDTSPYGEILNEVAQTIIDLDLTGIKTRVYVGKQLEPTLINDETLRPHVQVTMAPESTNDFEGPLGKATVHYPVMVHIIWGTDRGQRDNWATQLLQRSQVSQKFRKTRPTWTLANSELKKTTVRAGEPFIPEAVRKAVDAQWLLIDVHVVESLTHA